MVDRSLCRSMQNNGGEAASIYHHATERAIHLASHKISGS